MIKEDKRDIPYVVVQHKQTGKAFAMSRGYKLMNADVPTAVKVWMIRNSVQDWEGWMPTEEAQLPEWTRGLNESEFHAYWIDYDKKYQELVAVNGR
jgi:hypothetical protein